MAPGFLTCDCYILGYIGPVFYSGEAYVWPFFNLLSSCCGFYLMVHSFKFATGGCRNISKMTDNHDKCVMKA